MDICEKVAYIKGLAEGLSLDENTKEGKILAAVIDVLSDITDEICEIEDGCDELMEQLDAVDEDLSNVEDIIYGDDDCDCCDDDCDCCDDDEELYEIECPACHDTVYLDEARTAEQNSNSILTAAIAAAATATSLIPTKTRRNNSLNRNSECVMRNFNMGKS